MRKILILFAHPAQSRSVINTALRREIEALENVTLHDLYASYPDFLIDVKEEQRLCESHDVIVFQHPFYWYSSPSIVKEWLDLVLQHGWAYGSSGRALEGKIFFQALTAGGDDQTYQREGYNQFTIAELTSPMRATANLCKMVWLPPFAVLGVHRGLETSRLAAHTIAYSRLLTALRDEQLDLQTAQEAVYLNQNLEALIGGT